MHITMKKINNKKKMGKVEEEEEEPASPSARLMQAKELNLCIISVIGYHTTIDPSLYKKSVDQTLLKHPRFSCILMENKGKCWWRRTHVDVDDHIIVPCLDPDTEPSDKFVEDYVANLSKMPLDMSKPPWEIHILNVQTSDAKAIAIFKLHHSMGDGVSLMALCHACSKRISDPESLPKMPLANKNEKRDKCGLLRRLFVLVWTIFAVMVYTLVDGALFLATIMFLKDRQTPIKAPAGAVLPYKRFVHRIVNLDDVKLVKTVMNASINDVVLGVTEAGLSRYLSTRYEKDGENGGKTIKKSTNSLPRNLQLRSTVVFNLRPTPTIEDIFKMMETQELNGMWGNAIGIALVPFTISLQEDPLTHIRRAKSNMDRKKLSLGHKSALLVMKTLMFLFGAKAAARVTRAVFTNTTFTFSNVMGPQEEVKLFGHHLAYISPSVCGFTQSLIVHFQSYAGKIIISIGADEKLIPNPHQLCDDLVKSLGDIKEAVIKTALLNGDHNV